MTAWGKQEEEPGLHIPVPWNTSHLLPLCSHGISIPGFAFYAALPPLYLNKLVTLGQVTKLMDALKLTEKGNELGLLYS